MPSRHLDMRRHLLHRTSGSTPGNDRPSICWNCRSPRGLCNANTIADAKDPPDSETSDPELVRYVFARTAYLSQSPLLPSCHEPPRAFSDAALAVYTRRLAAVVW